MKLLSKIIIAVIIAAAVIIILLFCTGTISTGINKEAASDMPISTQEVGENSFSTPTPIPQETVLEKTAEPSHKTDLSFKKDNKDDKVEFYDNKIEVEVYDPVKDEKVIDTVETSGEEKLSYPLDMIAKQYFNKELNESPLDPNYINLDDDKLYIDFKQNIYSANLGSYIESEMLLSIAKSYTDNISGLSEVYISVDGADYSSGHIELSKDKPYPIN